MLAHHHDTPNPLFNFPHHLLIVPQYLLITKSQKPNPFVLDLLLSTGVASPSFISIMALSVCFNSEPQLGTVEVHNILLNTVLPAKLISKNLSLLETVPQRFFCGSCVSSQILPSWLLRLPVVRCSHVVPTMRQRYLATTRVVDPSLALPL